MQTTLYELYAINEYGEKHVVNPFVASSANIEYFYVIHSESRRNLIITFDRHWINLTAITIAFEYKFASYSYNTPYYLQVY